MTTDNPMKDRDERIAFAAEADAFADWQATRQFAERLDDKAEADLGGVSGFYYADATGSICGHIEAREWGFGVVIENTEDEFAKLEDAEAHLWDRWAKHEMAHR